MNLPRLLVNGPATSDSTSYALVSLLSFVVDALIITALLLSLLACHLFRFLFFFFFFFSLFFLFFKFVYRFCFFSCCFLDRLPAGVTEEVFVEEEADLGTR